MTNSIKLLLVNFNKSDSLLILNKLLKENLTISIINRADNLTLAKRYQLEYDYNLVFINCDNLEDDIFRYINSLSHKDILWNIVISNINYNFMRQALRNKVNDVILKNLLINEKFSYLSNIFSVNTFEDSNNNIRELGILLSNIKDNQNVDKKVLEKLLVDCKLYENEKKYYLSLIRIDNIAYWYRFLDVDRNKIAVMFKNFIYENIDEKVKVIFSKKHSANLLFDSNIFTLNEVEIILSNLVKNSKTLIFSISAAYSIESANLSDFYKRYKEVINLHYSKFYTGIRSVINNYNRVSFKNIKNEKNNMNFILNMINRENYKNAIYINEKIINTFYLDKVDIESAKNFYYDLIDSKIEKNKNNFNAFFYKELYKLLIRSSDDISSLKINSKLVIRAMIVYNKQSNYYKNTEYIIEADKYIKDNIFEKIYLKDISDILNLSESYFSRIFKRKTQTSFTNYVNKLKIEKSKELLLDNNLSIRDISEMLKFSNQFYFSKIFKDYIKMTPTEYKKINKDIN